MFQLTQQVRDDVLRELQKSVRPDLFNTWCKKLNFISGSDNFIKTPVPNKFYQEFFEKELKKSIEDAFLSVLGKRIEIIFDVTDKHAENVESSLTINSQIESLPETATLGNIVLNENYTFENFVVGPSNRMAYAGAIAVSESPAKKYNPLFIHGAVGLGKTHLLQAICNSVVNRNPNAKIVYLSCESFINNYIYAIQKGTVESFRKKYRSADALVIDDIHFLSKVKGGSHEEFFHTFNALHTARKQIVLSSDSSANEIPMLEDRLVSRFGWGLSAKIEPPDYETRVAIIGKRLELIGRTFPDDVISYIATNVEDNIRHIEGTITNVVAMASLTNAPIDMNFVRSIIKSNKTIKPSRITVPDILQIVAKYYSIKPDEFRAKRWKKSTSTARQMAIYLAKKFTACSLKEIGAHFGGKDHSTIIYSIKKIEKAVSKGTTVASDIELLSRQIKSYR